MLIYFAESPKEVYVQFVLEPKADIEFGEHFDADRPADLDPGQSLVEFIRRANNVIAAAEEVAPLGDSPSGVVGADLPLSVVAVYERRISVELLCTKAETQGPPGRADSPATATQPEESFDSLPYEIEGLRH